MSRGKFYILRKSRVLFSSAIMGKTLRIFVPHIFGIRDQALKNQVMKILNLKIT